MKKNIIAVLTYITLIPLSFSQNTLSKYLADKETKAPLKSATIHNANDYTVTNDDGHFVFYSTNDSVTIKMLGYENPSKLLSKALSRTKRYLVPYPQNLFS